MDDEAPGGDADEAPPEEAVRREALRWALAQVERRLGRILHVHTEVPGTAPGFRLLAEVHGVGGVFLKVADGSPWSAEAVGAEAALLTTLRHRHLPRVLAAEPAEDVPWLALPDLSAARWPPPWPDDVRPLHTAVGRLGRATPPPWLPRAEDVDPWADLLAVDAAAWWRPHAPALAEAARRVSIAGDGLVHGDLGSGNLCIAGGQPVVVDWSDAHVGNPEMDLVTLAVDIAHTGGPRVLPPVADPAAWLSKVGGMLIAAAAREAWPGPGGAAVRRTQDELARTAIGWAIELLGLGPP